MLLYFQSFKKQLTFYQLLLANNLHHMVVQVWEDKTAVWLTKDKYLLKQLLFLVPESTKQIVSMQINDVTQSESNNTLAQ